MHLPDFVDELLRFHEHPDADSRKYRRQVIEHLVETLTEMAGAEPERTGDQHHEMIMRLTVLIRDMTGRIAEADDANFSVIVGESAMLVRTLQRRRDAIARFTVH